MKKILLYIALLSLCGVTQAAKVHVTWKNPTENTDATPLINLSYIIVEWGSCVGTGSAPTFGTVQSSRLIVTTVAGADMETYVYPTGLNRVCVRAIAFNMAGVGSVYSNVAFKDLLPGVGKPVTLGQPVIISFNKQEN